ncbi:type II toxin-antitoxin system VapC family toxin [Gemmatimonas sp.]|uniref:type II toxin-antitoxin system VapC family toxin n=1 Tax=Gemmatimonas sp. TaxID=1962908 RepID=UPI003982EC9F
MIYTLDTNILIDALRRPAEMLLLKEFLEWALPRTTLSSVVASELLAGARTDAARRLVERELLGAFERRGRIVAPSVAAWAKTGIVLGRATSAAIGASWQNDLLLAHTAREFGWSLITRDKNFRRIRSLVRGLRVEAPFPRRPTIARGAI